MSYKFQLFSFVEIYSELKVNMHFRYSHLQIPEESNIQINLILQKIYYFNDPDSFIPLQLRTNVLGESSREIYQFYCFIVFFKNRKGFWQLHQGTVILLFQFCHVIILNLENLIYLNIYWLWISN